MNKTNVKWYLVGTENEVKIGDEVSYYQNVSFTKYPNSSYETTVTHPLDEDDVKTLIESEILVEKEVKNDYITYLKELAKNENKSYVDVLKSFTLLCELNPRAALSMLLKAISINFYGKDDKDKSMLRKVWIYDSVREKTTMIDIENPQHLDKIAYFKVKSDLDGALEICKPILAKLSNN